MENVNSSNENRRGQNGGSHRKRSGLFSKPAWKRILTQAHMGTHGYMDTHGHTRAHRHIRRHTQEHAEAYTSIHRHTVTHTGTKTGTHTQTLRLGSKQLWNSVWMSHVLVSAPTTIVQGKLPRGKGTMSWPSLSSV